MQQKIIELDLDTLDWNKGDGLLPLIAQDARTLRVLMLGFVNREAMKATLESGFVTFYSRTKQRLWRKGETSGNMLRVLELRNDCDNDSVLALVEPAGPTCHTGAQSCFGDDATPSLSTLAELAKTIHQRKTEAQPDKSYTAKLLAEGVTRIAQKVGEEGVETALAAATQSPKLAEEAADLLYHLLVLLESRDTDWLDVMRVLAHRAGK
ncbi:MAG: bifunctional phosphoribosyl-AMP cyclohydrolase/phosphoribosyl-ATP diphosphatase HisIE [Bdellovibrionales bacterium]